MIKNMTENEKQGGRITVPHLSWLVVAEQAENMVRGGGGGNRASTASLPPAFLEKERSHCCPPHSYSPSGKRIEVATKGGYWRDGGHSSVCCSFSRPHLTCIINGTALCQVGYMKHYHFLLQAWFSQMNTGSLRCALVICPNCVACVSIKTRILEWHTRIGKVPSYLNRGLVMFFFFYHIASPCQTHCRCNPQSALGWHKSLAKQHQPKSPCRGWLKRVLCAGSPERSQRPGRVEKRWRRVGKSQGGRYSRAAGRQEVGEQEKKPGSDSFIRSWLLFTASQEWCFATLVCSDLCHLWRWHRSE